MPDGLYALLEVARDGLAHGAVWFLVALGLSMTRWLTGILDLSQPAYALLAGALTLWMGGQTGLSTISAGMLALLVIALIAVAARLLVFAPLQGHTPLETLAATGAIAFILIGVARLLVGRGPVLLEAEARGTSSLIGLPPAGLSMTATAILVLVGVVAGLRFTRFGIVLRATAERPKTAPLLGIDPRQVHLLLYVAGAVLAGLAGILGNAMLLPDTARPFAMLPGLLILLALVPPGRFIWLFVASVGLGIVQVSGQSLGADLGPLPILVTGLLALVLVSEVTRRRS